MSSNRKILENITSRSKVYLVIIAILLIIICIYEKKFIIPAILIYVLVLMYTFWFNDKKKSEVFRHIQELTSDVDSAAKNTLVNSPFPLVIESNGSIIWKNQRFKKEFANIDIGKQLDEIIKEIKNTNKPEEKVQIDKQITVGNNTYHVVGEYGKNKKSEKKDSKENSLVLYFINNTEETNLIKQCNDMKICVGIVMIDNYDEIMQRIESAEKPQIIATIENELYKWASETGGLMIQRERDSFIYLFEQKYMQHLENKKFNILDTIKDIELNEKMQLTLSIGISVEGNNYYDKYKSALAAIDIALGRGGDQVVIRKNGEYNFFGGRTLEIEKRTKVKARIIAHALEELILEAKNVVIMGHSNPDIDSIGASLGMYRLAKTLGKEAYIVNNELNITLGNFSDVLKNEEEYKDILIDKNEAIAKTSSGSLLIVVDTHKKSYVEVPILLEETDKIVVIDHHRKSTDFIETPILSFHEVYASSASELVVEILQYAKKDINLNSVEIEALYGGIMVDTKNFTFKTGVRTFEAAAYLRKCGVDIVKVKKWFQSDLDSYNKISEIVRNVELVKDVIGISLYKQVDKDATLTCAKAADELLTIRDISASFVIGNMGDKICISGRSAGDINVQVILEKLGGGGHITFAGAQVEGKSLEEVKQKLISKINEYYEEMT